MESMSETTSSRLLSLLSLLQARRDWPGSELAERLEVSPRTIRRDVERLRQLGYPVESLTGPAGGYQLRAGTAMPPLLLDDDEAIAIAVGLRTAAQTSVAGIEETSVRALVKLEQVLPSHLRRRVRALQEATSTLPGGGGPTVDPQCLTIVASAVRDHERVRFAYRGRDGASSRREVEPHSVVNLGRRWYVVGWDRARDDWRTFRFDRLANPASTGVRFAPRTLPGGKDAAKFVADNLSNAPQRYEARITLHCPADEVRARPYLWGTVEPTRAETCEYRTGDDNLDWLALRIAMLGVEFEVHEPPELREHLTALMGRVGRAVGGR
jgi:predicted DNA-binding transcriptional regulator YafY